MGARADSDGWTGVGVAEPSAGPLHDGTGDAGPVLRGAGSAIPAVGELVAGKYRVEGVLGSGGMGVVVGARDERLGRLVAVKLPTTSHARAAARLVREARAAAAIRSEHVAAVLDVDVTERGAPFIVMEHLEGEDLAAHLRRCGRLPLREAAGYLIQACDALDEAHALGIVHRDLKPSNLFVTRRSGAPFVKVLDFGIAKHGAPTGGGADPHSGTTATGAVMGSPRYMSPEQVRDAKSVDARSDVWSLGVILYELLAGRSPFEAASAPAVCAKIVADPPVPLHDAAPGLPDEVEAVVTRCLEKDLARRLSDVASLAMALRPFAARWARPAAKRVAARRCRGPALGRPADGDGSRGALGGAGARHGGEPERARAATPADTMAVQARVVPARGARSSRISMAIFAALGLAFSVGMLRVLAPPGRASAPAPQAAAESVVPAREPAARAADAPGLASAPAPGAGLSRGAELAAAIEAPPAAEPRAAVEPAPEPPAGCAAPAAAASACAGRVPPGDRSVQPAARVAPASSTAAFAPPAPASRSARGDPLGDRW